MEYMKAAYIYHKNCRSSTCLLTLHLPSPCYTVGSGVPLASHQQHSQMQLGQQVHTECHQRDLQVQPGQKNETFYLCSHQIWDHQWLDSDE
jgi:hypothetical protein